MTEYRYFDRLKESLEQATAFQKGDMRVAKVSVRAINVPAYKASDISKLRLTLRLSQRGLAFALGVSPRTVEAWESGRNSPCGSSRHLLYLFEKDNSLIRQFVE
jgi:putative transcriptional regulator